MRFLGADLQMPFCVIVYLCVSHQVVDLIGQLHLLVCILESFIIVLENTEGLGCDSALYKLLIADWLQTFHTPS